MFRFLILVLACLPLHRAMAQMPGAVPGGWNGSVALPHATMAPLGPSIPATSRLAHFAPLPGSDRSIGMSSPTGYEHGQTGSRDMPTPTDDNDARQDWNAFQQAERQVLRNMHRTP